MCNGSTTDSDSVCLGSNPSSATTSEQAIKRLLRLFFKNQCALMPLLLLFRKRSRCACAVRLQARSRRSGLPPAFCSARRGGFFTGIFPRCSILTRGAVRARRAAGAPPCAKLRRRLFFAGVFTVFQFSARGRRGGPAPYAAILPTEIPYSGRFHIFLLDSSFACDIIQPLVVFAAWGGIGWTGSSCIRI